MRRCWNEWTASRTAGGISIDQVDIDIAIATVQAEQETRGAVDMIDNHRLRQALVEASQASRRIEREQGRIDGLLREAETETERKAREYQRQYVAIHLNRAARLAEKRLRYFATLKDPATETMLCQSDVRHWFEYYAWGYDPRPRSPLNIVPFELYPKQAEMLDWLQNQVFRKRASGVVEKSRDEGATETIVRWGLFHWLYSKGFSMLLSTRKEDEVDSKENQNTLFERIRFQIKLLPQWMLPEGFDVLNDMKKHMQIANPENGSTLIGEAPVINMGRGGRVTCAMLDEFAFWAHGGYPQFRSLSQTTDSIIMPSSVNGKQNQYAELAHDGHTAKFVLDWRENPFKDKRWYDALPYGYISPKMNRTAIAQEVDRDYESSRAGRVWTFDESRIFIRRSEFLSAFEAFADNPRYRHIMGRFHDKEGNFRIPYDWRVVRTSDYGKSDGHDWSYALFAQPTEFYPLSDIHFCFIARNLEPTGIQTEQAVAQWKTLEHSMGIRHLNGDWINKPVASYNSHEQKNLRQVLLNEYGEAWTAWETDYQTGIENIEDWFTPKDMLKPNPFRRDLTGTCKLVFVAPDDSYFLAHDERLGRRFVTPSKTEEGFLTARAQLQDYHYPESEMGKPPKEQRPVKQFDDIVDAVRGYAVMWDKDAKEATLHEKVAAKLETTLPPLPDGSDDTQINRSHNTNRQILAENTRRELESGTDARPSFRRIG